MLEIHNEEVKDLLGKGPPAGKKHDIMHATRRATSVAFLEQCDRERSQDDCGRATPVAFLETVNCEQAEQVEELLARATKLRSVGEQSKTAPD